MNVWYFLANFKLIISENAWSHPIFFFDSECPTQRCGGRGGGGRALLDATKNGCVGDYEGPR